jgi:acetoin utilization protein AcuB
MVRVGDVMTKGTATLASEVSAQEATRLAKKLGVHHFLVMEGDCILGVVCLCDLAEAGANEPISDCMTAPVACVEETASLAYAARTMKGLGVNCLPVVRAGRPLGLVTWDDVRAHGPGAAAASIRAKFA